MYAARHLDTLIKASTVEPVIRFHPTVSFDGYGVMTVGDWGGYLIQIMPMAYNDRLVMTPASLPSVYDFGWCFPKGPAPVLAALVWNPETEGEPKGFIKRIGSPRQPGETADGFTWPNG